MISKLPRNLKDIGQAQKYAVKVNLSRRTIGLLEQLKQQYGLNNRGQVLEMIIEQLLEDPESKSHGLEE